MEFMLILVFVLIGIHITIPQHTSSEDINKILDRLIQQVNESEAKLNGEISEQTEPYYPVPIDAGNEPGTQQSRSDTNYDDSEPYSNYIDKNFLMLQDLFAKDLKKKTTTERSPYGYIPSKSLSMLHDYPEIVIDHISYNNDKIESPPSETQNSAEIIQTVSEKLTSSTKSNLNDNGDNSHKTTPKPTKATQAPTETSKQNNFEDQKSLLDSIAQYKAVYESLVKEIVDRKSRKQDILLEKILEQISESRQHEETPELESRAVTNPVAVYPLKSKVAKIRLLPTTLHRNIVPSTIVPTAVVRSPTLVYNWTPNLPMTSYLGRRLLNLSTVRALQLQRARLAGGLLGGGMPRYIFRRYF